MLAVSLLVAACGGSSDSGTAAATASPAPAVTASPTTGSDDSSPGACPSVAPKKFRKAATAAHIAVAAGAVQHFIIKPARAGQFAKGQPKRTRRVLVAVAAAAVAKHELSAAKDAALQDPSLCPWAQKFSSWSGKLGTAALLAKIKDGTVGAGDLSGTSDLGELDGGLSTIEKEFGIAPKDPAGLHAP